VADAAWEAWEQLRSEPDPDPLRVLEAVAAFRSYFSAVEREAIKVARVKGKTWNEIGAALGKTGQAVWQRVSSRHDAEQLARAFEESWTRSAEVYFQMGAWPPR
jgi:hypothetical protein